jgi:hypothetical protein
MAAAAAFAAALVVARAVLTELVAGAGAASAAALVVAGAVLAELVEGAGTDLELRLSGPLEAPPSLVSTDAASGRGRFLAGVAVTAVVSSLVVAHPAHGQHKPYPKPVCAYQTRRVYELPALWVPSESVREMLGQLLGRNSGSCLRFLASLRPYLRKLLS